MQRAPVLVHNDKSWVIWHHWTPSVTLWRMFLYDAPSGPVDSSVSSKLPECVPYLGWDLTSICQNLTDSRCFVPTCTLGGIPNTEQQEIIPPGLYRKPINDQTEGPSSEIIWKYSSLPPNRAHQPKIRRTETRATHGSGDHSAHSIQHRSQRILHRWRENVGEACRSAQIWSVVTVPWQKFNKRYYKKTTWHKQLMILLFSSKDNKSMWSNELNTEVEVVAGYVDCLTLEDGIHRLSRNVGNLLPINAV